MKIKDILAKRSTLSFEFFPPKSATGVNTVFETIDCLKVFRPDFVSVTYGAGGSTRMLTEEISLRIKEDKELLVMAHITCVSQSRDQIHKVLSRYDTGGIENVIALRGDLPKSGDLFMNSDDLFPRAIDLIEHIRANFNFGLAAACYPEGHPETMDLKKDVEYAKRKVDKGAEFLISQLFFDNSHFYRFRDLARQNGINVPILAGLLPILSTKQIRRFTALCGASIPASLDNKLDLIKEDEHAVRNLGISQATSQTADLLTNDVDGIHFYALNKAHSIQKILEDLGISGHDGSAID